MHYSKHRPTASVVYFTWLRSRTRASTNDQRARPACPLVSSSKN